MENTYQKSFEDLTLAELKELFETACKQFDKRLNEDALTQEYYNDDGEYNLLGWLKGAQ